MTNLPTHIAQYKVLREIGRGRFGRVYTARDIHLHTQVVLKVLNPDLLNDQAIIKTFEHEANVLARLNHPNIVHVRTFDLDHSPPYLVTEQVVGQMLADKLSRKRILADSLSPKRMFSLSEALPLLRQMAAALDVAHVNRLIHRHLSPASIFITHDGRVKLVDFGLIKRTCSAITNGVGKQVQSGNANYIAPEQTEINRQHEISSSTDIYAFGVITYEMLTGRLPFEGSQEAVRAAHEGALPPNPRVFHAKLSPTVANVLMQVLAKQPSNRFATAGRFVKALEQAQVAIQDKPTRIYSDPIAQNGNTNNNGQAVTPTPKQSTAISDSTNPLNTNGLLAGPTTEPATEVLYLPGSTTPTKTHSAKPKYRKRAIALALLLALLLLGGLSATWWLSANGFGTSESEQVIPAVPAVPDAQVLSEEGLYMRVGPGIEYEIVAMYPTDTALRVIGRDLESNWLQVETPDGQLGWMYAPFLSINISLDNVPFAPPPPAPLRRQL